MYHSRRSFLKVAGAAAVAATLPGTLRGAPRLPRIALQLYSIREAMAKDAPSALARVAAMGYRAVETAFFPEGWTLKKAAHLLADSGLHAVACHVEIPVGEHKDAMLETAEAFGAELMVWHGWPEDPRYGTVDGIKELAEIYNEASAFAQANGLRFGVHNHWWELEEVPEGVRPWYILRDLVEPEVFFEVDTWWAKVAGMVPAQVVADFGSRAPLLHIKDGAILGEEGPMVAVGDGLQDFPSIAEAAGDATEYMIVELDDCDTDMFDALAKSYEFLTGTGLAAGS